MKLNRSLCIAILGVMAVAFVETKSHAAVPSAANDPIAIVKAACTGAATANEFVPPGNAGRTVVVLEEAHNSLAVQLELASVLVRLHDAGFIDLVLEGYLKDDASGAALKPVSRDWFRKAAGALSPDVQRETAARLLKEGEISAAEFFFLAYDDTRLIPAETPKFRGREYRKKHSMEVATAFTEIAQAVLREARANGRVDVKKFNPLAIRAKSAIGKEARGQAVQALMDYVVALDPWLESAYGTLNTATSPLADLARLQEELIVQAKAWDVPVDTALLEDGAQFFHQRENANEPMVASTVATKPLLVALNIGAAHTEGMVESLKAKGLGVILITPLSLEDDMGKLSSSQFEAKEELRSVFDVGQIAQALTTLPAMKVTTKKKPEPSITESWAQAKGELYLFISQLTRSILGPPAPQGDGQPPFGFDGAFRGRFLFIEPQEARYLASDAAIIFPIRCIDDPGKVFMWVKSWQKDLENMPESGIAQSGVALAPVADSDRLVALLLAYRDAVKARGEASSTAEDGPAKDAEQENVEDVSMVQIDMKTLAAVGFDEKAVASAVVSSR